MLPSARGCKGLRKIRDEGHARLARAAGQTAWVLFPGQAADCRCQAVSAASAARTPRGMSFQVPGEPLSPRDTTGQQLLNTYSTRTCTGSTRWPAGRLGTEASSSASFFAGACTFCRGSVFSPPRPYIGTTCTQQGVADVLKTARTSELDQRRNDFKAPLGVRALSCSMPALHTGHTRQWLCTCIHLRALAALKQGKSARAQLCQHAQFSHKLSTAAPLAHL